jgi:hypothetical protein
VNNCRWDALGQSEEKVKNEDDTSGIKTEANGEDVEEGRIWHVQAHARSSITSMKVDPVNGSGVSSPLSPCFFFPHVMKGSDL